MRVAFLSLLQTKCFLSQTANLYETLEQPVKTTRAHSIIPQTPWKTSYCYCYC